MKTVHVAVGILINVAGAVLISRRPDHVHQGGLWEFPGGKVEEGEPVTTALSRELHEELGVTVESAESWLQVRHDYPDKRVFLDVWRVMIWRNEPQGREGQPLLWVLPAELERFAFPAADKPIINALIPFLKSRNRPDRTRRRLNKRRPDGEDQVVSESE